MLYHLIIAGGLVLFTLNLLLNLRALKKPRADSRLPEGVPLISVMVPARDIDEVKKVVSRYIKEEII